MKRYYSILIPCTLFILLFSSKKVAAQCSVTYLSPGTFHFKYQSEGPQGFSLAVDDPNGECGIVEAIPSESWITAYAYDNNGGYLNCLTNTGPYRSGFVFVGDQSVFVEQDGAPGTIEPVGPIYTDDGAMANNQNVCRNDVISYHVARQNVADTYNWTITGGEILSGQGSDKISVRWGPGSSGTLYVYAANAQHQSLGYDATFTIHGTINIYFTGGDVPACNNTAVTFYANGIGGLITSYQWQMRMPGATEWATLHGATQRTYAAVALASTHNSQYRCIVDGCGGTVTTGARSVLLRPVPQVQVTLAGNESLSTGQQGLYTLTASNPNGYTLTYTWFRNGTAQTASDNAASVASQYIPVASLTTEDVIHGVVKARDSYACTTDVSSNAIRITRQGILPPRENAVISNKVLTKGNKDAALVTMENLTASGLQQSIGYYDGLGRLVQTVQTQASPDFNDIIQPVAYDEFDRESVKYLPFTPDQSTGNYYPNAVGEINNNHSTSPHHQFYQSAQEIAHDEKPYAQATFEVSPLNRILQQGAPGEAWQPNGLPELDKSIKKEYGFNKEGEVILFDYNEETAQISFTDNSALKYYPPSQLYADKTIDEHNNEVIEYTDRDGKTVLKSVQYKEENGVKFYAKTYYIYDDLGNLVVVLPPEAVEAINATIE
jgi:hypothetical protein